MNITKLIIGSLSNKKAIEILENSLIANKSIYSYEHKCEILKTIDILENDSSALYNEYVKILEGLLNND